MITKPLFASVEGNILGYRWRHHKLRTFSRCDESQANFSPGRLAAYNAQAQWESGRI